MTAVSDAPYAWKRPLVGLDNCVSKPTSYVNPPPAKRKDPLWR